MKFVFFDLDNTLTDRKETITAYANHFQSEFLHELKTDIPIGFLSATFNDIDNGGYVSHKQRFAAIAALDIWATPQNPDNLSSHWQNWVPNNSMPMTGMKACLDELLAMGLRLCLVSNAQNGHNQRAKLKKLGIENVFDEIVISAEVGFEKPDKRIFDYALNKMNAKACDSFFIGDHPVNDYKGSYDLGFKSIWIEGAHSWPATAEALLKISDLNELCPLIRTLSNVGKRNQVIC